MNHSFSALLGTSFVYAAALSGRRIQAKFLGRVIDNTGSVIIGATIQVGHTDTGVESKTVTNDAGKYLLAPLPPGNTG